MGSSALPPAGTVGLTYADLLDLPVPEEAGGARYELLDGELLLTPAPVIRHQRSVGQVYAALLAHTRVHGGLALVSPTDVWFSDQTVFEPDVLAMAGDHLDRVESHRVVGPPDLVVEVSSPATRRTDVVRKRRVYEREGVPEFWYVDRPRRGPGARRPPRRRRDVRATHGGARRRCARRCRVAGPASARA